jgi:4,5-DOPA dioxygenase extradiol
MIGPWICHTFLNATDANRSRIKELAAMERKSFIKILASIPIVAAAARLNAFGNLVNGFPGSPKMPVLFIGHGHPINAILDNAFTQAIARLGERLEKPKAILVVSAHWQTKGTFVSTNPHPMAIYDFKGLDERLSQIKYEPDGCPEIAREAIQSSPNSRIQEAETMGLDHGAWTVLMHLYPKADVPVFQLSLDSSLSTGAHFKLAGELKRMREKGVLIIGSGNVVHNLRTLVWNDINAKTLDWAVEFDGLVKRKLNERDFKSLVDYQSFGDIARLAHPTNEHYLPMLYALGLAGEKEDLEFLFEGFQFGSASMLTFQIG